MSAHRREQMAPIENKNDNEKLTQDEITQERLKRFKTIRTTVTDKDINHYFKNKLAINY